MRGAVLALDTWLVPNYQPPARVYLDVSDWETFTDWLAEDVPARVQPMLDRRWGIYLFKWLLNHYFGSNGQRTKRLNDLGIQLENATLRDDEMFIAEVLRAYFHNDPSSRPQAELLAMARRREGNGRITIISQHQGFWRVPMVDTFFIPNRPLKGAQDLPAQFDFFIDLGIHSEIRRAAEQRLQNGDTALAIQQSVQNIYNYLRQRAVCTHDGQDLIIHCLSRTAWEQPGKQALVGPTPRLSVNPFTTNWEEKEQLGIRDIGLGIQRVIRNPLAHVPVTDPHIMNRFSDKREVLKLLCLLSYFLERVDVPKP